MNYQKQAVNFCKKYKTEITIEEAKIQSPPLWYKEGEEYGIKYDITIKRENKDNYSFSFWNSIANKEKIEFIKEARERGYIGGGFNSLALKKYIKPLEIREIQKEYKENKFKPCEYDILACITKNDPESFGDFCAEFGYSEFCEDCGDINKENYKVYKSVVNEWENINRLFSDCLEELAEIA